MKKRCKTIVLLCLLAMPLTAHGERFFNVWETSYGWGTPGPTASWLDYISEIGPGVALHNAKLTIGHQYDSQDFGDARQGFYYPVMGFSLSYQDYTHCHLSGKFNYTGEHYNWGRFLALSWHHSQYYVASGKFRLRTLWDMGFAYNFNHHDESLPNILMPMGGHLQIYLEMGLLASIQTRRYEWSIGPHFIHNSNSNTNEPNSGINNLGVTLSVRQGAGSLSSSRSFDASKSRDFETSMPRSLEGSTARTHPRFYLDLMGGLGYTRVEMYPQNLYGQFNFCGAALWQYNPHSAIGLGYDASYLPRGDRDDRQFYQGLSFVHTLWMRQWAIQGQVGAYLGPRHPIMWKDYSRVYERLALRYHFVRPTRDHKLSPYISFGVKGDGFVAQQLETSIGVCVF